MEKVSLIVCKYKFKVYFCQLFRFHSPEKNQTSSTVVKEKFPVASGSKCKRYPEPEKARVNSAAVKEKLESGSRCKRSLSLDYSNTTTFMEQIRLLEETRIHWDNDQITTLETGVLAIDSRTNNPGVIARKCKELRRPQRVCILEWVRLNPEELSFSRQIFYNSRANGGCKGFWKWS